MKPESHHSKYAFPLTIAAVAVALFAVIFAMTFQSAGHLGTGGSGRTFTNPFGSSNELKKFSSYQEMSDFLSKVQGFFASYQSNNNANNGAMRLGPALGSGSAMYGPSAPEYSTGGQISENAQSSLEAATGSDALYSSTNVQVEGVDESDFLKNDGKYAYILSGHMLSIVDAYPPENAKLVSRFSLDIPAGQYAQNMFLNGDKLEIFYQSYSDIPLPPVQSDSSGNNLSYPPQQISEPMTNVLVIDISDRSSPKTLRNYEILGQYSSSRMIDDRVFLLTVSAVDSPKPAQPSVHESSSKLTINPDVYYFDYPQQSYALNTITSLNLDEIRATPSKDDNAGAADDLISKTFMIGAGSTIYVSDRNIYIAYSENPWSIPVMQQGAYGAPAQYRDFVASTSMQSTVIHKISIASGSLFDYGGKAEVPGMLLNQFSIHESGDRFTVATTSESQSLRGFSMENNVYRFDTNMKMVGKLERIAEGESIYAARFMGDRLYLVTFRQTDPFFVIDLSHDNQQVLGKLKLPGYSNYLHPYDDSHIIGFGREGPESGNQGVKLALFDVSDLDNPRVIDTYVIGGSQTDSEVLRDHKALLFSKEKDLLSIPVYSYDGYYYYRDDSGKSIDPLSKVTGLWNGFYVFGLTPKDGFELKGTIQHDASSDGIDMSQGSRSFFINEALYTVTPGLLKINDLADVEHELNHIELSQ